MFIFRTELPYHPKAKFLFLLFLPKEYPLEQHDYVIFFEKVKVKNAKALENTCKLPVLLVIQFPFITI